MYSHRSKYVGPTGPVPFFFFWFVSSYCFLGKPSESSKKKSYMYIEAAPSPVCM